MKRFLIELFNWNNHVAVFKYLYDMIFSTFTQLKTFFAISMLFLFVALIFYVLPYFIITFISQKQRKMWNKIDIVLLDIFIPLFLFVICCDFTRFLINTFMHISTVIHAYMTIDDYIKTSNYVELIILNSHIGVLCSALYTFLLSFKLFKKYMVKLEIDKYEKVIYRVTMGLFVFFVYAFILIFHVTV